MAEHVFVYGSLKQGLHNCQLLAEAEFVGLAETAEPEFRMGNVGTYPEITRTDSSAAGYILGEVYLCDQSTLARLDRLEGTSYRRELVATRLSDATSDVIVAAWTYLWLRPPCPDVAPIRIQSRQAGL